MHSRSRRDFLKILCLLAGGALLRPAWQINAAAGPIPIPPTIMLHSKDRWKLVNILRWLRDNGYNSLTYRQFLDVIQGNAALPDRPIILTIDDVGSSFILPYYMAMVEAVERQGYTGVLGVVTRDSPLKNPDNWATLRGMADRGWQLDTHTTHHHVLPQVKTLDELRAEIVDSAQMIIDGTGQTPTSLIVPYANPYLRGGKFDQRIFDVSTEGNLSFVVGMKEGRFVNPIDHAPYYLGRVGVGMDSTQEGWWITHFNSDEPTPQDNS
ncbi:MAG TPA: polysaccharide deacetylase family protein [Aggregatilineales bacterium]|nr:polysaccharide deacetylase family protein [Aggregatilineales bacterium]